MRPRPQNPRAAPHTGTPVSALMRWTHSCTRPTHVTPSRNKYNEWMLCLKKNDKDESKCFLPRFNMRELCPGEWVSSMCVCLYGHIVCVPFGGDASRWTP